MSDANLFGLPAKPKRQKADPLPSGTITRLIALWTEIFQGRYGEKPMIRPRDAAALKRMVLKTSEAVVAARLHLYLALDDDFVAIEGYPLCLMEDRWNKLIAASSRPQGRVRDAETTEAYIQRFKGR